jgi:large subunit ribosomal protein L19
MRHPIIDAIEKEYFKSDLPDIHPGDTVKVMVRIIEGNKERLQGYEGIVIKLQGRGLSRTMTVRRVFQGVGVERVFLLHSPKVDSIKVLRRGQVRRAKLYYLRERSGKSARIREKITSKAQ